jgi:hypothetical protein
MDASHCNTGHQGLVQTVELLAIALFAVALLAVALLAVALLAVALSAEQWVRAWVEANRK